ncbi:MAG: hypothetical protein ACYDD4_10625 [Acidimicrobiales bacterium]
MGLMDKIKSQAEQLAVKAQQGTSQVQTKFDSVQAKRTSDALLRDLGAAYYAEQRQGGPHDAVETALGQLDGHIGKTGAIDLSTAGPQPVPSTTTPADTPPAGDFKLD